MKKIWFGGRHRKIMMIGVLLSLFLAACGEQGLNDMEQIEDVAQELQMTQKVQSAQELQVTQPSQAEEDLQVAQASQETETLQAEEALQVEEASQAEEVPLPSDGEGWGLSFGEAGTQPVGNASVEILAQYDAYFIGDAEEKAIYLTFDCGYENGNTEPILDALKKHDVSATFFVVGHFLETAPELVKRMVEDGHTVGSHTYNHPDVTKIPDKQSFQEEMDAVRAKFKEVTDEELSMYYRPPEGKCSSKNMKAAQEMGYSTFFWSLAHVDWDTENQPKPEAAIEKLTARIHPGAIVLLHNTSRTNGEILDELLTRWGDMGYEVRPLAELIED